MAKLLFLKNLLKEVHRSLQEKLLNPVKNLAVKNYTQILKSLLASELKPPMLPHLKITTRNSNSPSLNTIFSRVNMIKICFKSSKLIKMRIQTDYLTITSIVLITTLRQMIPKVIPNLQLKDDIA